MLQIIFTFDQLRSPNCDLSGQSKVVKLFHQFGCLVSIFWGTNRIFYYMKIKQSNYKDEPVSGSSGRYQ